MASVTIHGDFGAHEKEICHYFHLFPFYLPCSNWGRCHDFICFLFFFFFFFKVFSLKPALSFSSFTLIKRVFSSSLPSAIRVLSSAFLRLLMFLPPFWILACNSSSQEFLMMCSAYRLNRKVDSRELSQYSFLNLEPISCSIKGSNCFFLIHIQVSQETGKMVWYSHISKSFPQFFMIHTVKGLSEVYETEVDFFFPLKFSCFLYNPANVGNFISGSFHFLNPAWTSGSSWFT